MTSFPNQVPPTAAVHQQPYRHPAHPRSGTHTGLH